MIYKNQAQMIKAKQCFYLLYGADEGKAYGIAEQIKSLWGERIEKINSEELEKQSALLHDELNSVGLFADSKLILLDCRDALSVKLQNQLVALLEKQNESVNHLLILAHNLTPTSKLRKFFEKAQHCAIMACYPPENREIASLLQQKLQAENITIDHDATQLFVQKVKGDSYRIEQEIEKLLLFKQGAQKVTSHDIQCLIGAHQQLQMSELIYSIFAGDRKKMEHLLQSDDIESIPILLAVRRHIVLLTEIKQISADNRQNIRQVIEQLRPPIFFKLKDSLTMQANKWQRGKLLKLYRQTLDIEWQVKWQASRGNMEAKRLLLEIVVG